MLNLVMHQETAFAKYVKGPFEGHFCAFVFEES